eukprot:TRINITY_DN1065_c0_g2_i6.p1 TRINITY_DN1065_c0_g2~~TRINITY_DN1065_c0_g2_i6.p1  ORF type:complete len:920 (-),score=274.82 TRINITY_DN1065_c0_g2_i6:172-2931(-)
MLKGQRKRLQKDLEAVREGRSTSDSIMKQEEEVEIDSSILEDASLVPPSTEDDVYEMARKEYDAKMSGHFESTIRHKRRKMSSRDEIHDDSAQYIAMQEGERVRKGSNVKEREVSFRNGLTVPKEIFSNLLQYQLTALRWMWELRKKSHGGILGDEMGLGKTIEVIGFLACLDHMGLFHPSLIICNKSLMYQWKEEIVKWWPKFNVSIFHRDIMKAGEVEASVVKNVLKKGHILIVPYETLRSRQELFVNRDWNYVILDEGHIIRNPFAEITLTIKQFRTPNRILLTGTPIQNRLDELWSLFDFVYPGRLGTLETFREEFAGPIRHGGSTSATPDEVELAYQRCVVLRELIGPFMLRRYKRDVNRELLPQKTEKIIKCAMTPVQKKIYKNYLASAEVEKAKRSTRTEMREWRDERRSYEDRAGDHNPRSAALGLLWKAVENLVKIGNHPDLFLPIEEGSFGYGNPNRSGKLLALLKILSQWERRGHRCLVYSQRTKILDIIESNVRDLGYSYVRLDGSMSATSRKEKIDSFKENEDIFMFLLSAKAGGYGLNLTSANRVIIFDPDWNPTTDRQAIERVYRLGQKKKVVIYRLMCVGSADEKLFYRQMFKTYISQKVLSDPRQTNFFDVPTLQDFLEIPPDEEEKEKDTDQSRRRRDHSTGLDFDEKDTDMKTGSSTGSRLYQKDSISPRMKKVSSLPSIDGADWEERRSSIEIVDMPMELFGDGDSMDINEEEDRETGMLENVMIGSTRVNRESITKDVEARAKEMAKAALEKLRKSRDEEYRTSVVFTEKTAPLLESKSVFPIAGSFPEGGMHAPTGSLAIIAASRNRQRERGETKQIVREMRRSKPADAVDRANEMLLREILEFIGSSVKTTTNDLKRRFKKKCPNAQLFSELLRQVAEYTKEGDEWRLKDEFFEWK